MSGRIIVTGGAGFIGANLVAALNARGQEDILVVDRLGEDEKWRNLNGLAFADYLDKDEFLSLARARKLGPVRGILHMGACSSTTETDADFLMRNNYEYTRELCERALEAGARFVYASSAATYGAGELGYSDDPALLPRLRPLNMYGYSKHLFDLWAMRRGLLGKIAGLKFFNVYGPREDHKGEMRSVVHRAFHEVRETGQIQLFKSYRPDFADGQQKRDFISVDDAAAVALYFLENSDRNGLFNCGTGRARTWIDLARAVFAAMGREPKIVFKEMPESLREKYQYFTEADMARLRAAGYAAEFASLEDGVKKYVGWMQAIAG